jgi:kumamolisin
MPSFDAKKNKKELADDAKYTGPADTSASMSVTVCVRRANGATLPNPLQSMPALTFLSREEFAAKYGAAEEDLKSVVSFGERHGLKEVVEKRSIPGRFVVLSGTVAQMSSAFGVKLNQYARDAELYRGHEDAICLPPELMDIVEGVFGLDNRRMARAHAAPGSATVVPTPPDIAKRYNFPVADGTGETIALLEFGNSYNPRDIQSFFAGPGPQIVSVPPDTPSDPPEREVTLDICVAGSVAPRAKIVLYFAPPTEEGWVQAVTAAVHDAINGPSVISISWGWPEFQSTGDLAWTKAAIAKVSELFQEAATLHIPVFAASGDFGSTCGVLGHKAHVEYPATDPWVTACGGTMFQNGTEVVWNNGNGTTGGGISDYFPLPPWQMGIGVPPSVNDHQFRRGIPDVAGYADGYNITYQGLPAISYGTSAVAPLWAGLFARLTQSLGHKLGCLNPYLYDEIKTAGAMNPIRDGDNRPVGETRGYDAGPGWNACTGWGAPDGGKILAALSAAPPPT